MLLVWFFMGLLHVLITEVWRKTAWSGLQTAAAVRSSKRTEIPAPHPRKPASTPRRLSRREAAGGPTSGGGEWRRGRASPYKGPSINPAGTETYSGLQIPNKDTS